MAGAGRTSPPSPGPGLGLSLAPEPCQSRPVTHPHPQRPALIIPQEVEASVGSSCHPEQSRAAPLQWRARGQAGCRTSPEGPGFQPRSRPEVRSIQPSPSVGRLKNKEQLPCLHTPGNWVLTASQAARPIPWAALATDGPSPAPQAHGPSPTHLYTWRPGAGRRGPGGSRTPPTLPCRLPPPARARAGPRGRRTARMSPLPSQAVPAAAPRARPGPRRPGTPGRGAPPRQHTQLVGGRQTSVTALWWPAPRDPLWPDPLAGPQSPLEPSPHVCTLALGHQGPEREPAGLPPTTPHLGRLTWPELLHQHQAPSRSVEHENGHTAGGGTQLSTEAAPSPHPLGAQPTSSPPQPRKVVSLAQVGRLRPRTGHSLPGSHSQARTQASCIPAGRTGAGGWEGHAGQLGRPGVAAAEDVWLTGHVAPAGRLPPATLLKPRCHPAHTSGPRGKGAWAASLRPKRWSRWPSWDPARAPGLGWPLSETTGKVGTSDTQRRLGLCAPGPGVPADITLGLPRRPASLGPHLSWVFMKSHDFWVYHSARGRAVVREG